ncbi:MAG: carboxypeptidase-like regulatory domain-containing protein [Tannerellaceae bacterium]|nr:carboxypeptidase-like regulatory domain-containing protein [Tannerellaceae bacterium]
MRVTTMLLFVVLFEAFAMDTYSQTAKVSLRAEQTMLTDLFTMIEQQSEFLFFYVDDDVQDIYVNVSVRNKTIHEVLDQALQGTGLDYMVYNRNINIVRKAISQQQSARKITGTITDNKGETIIGANIMVKGTTSGVISDINGEFSIEA